MRDAADKQTANEGNELSGSFRGGIRAGRLLKGEIELNFQEIYFRLERFWAEQGCVVQQPYDVEVGAGTMNPATALRVLGPEPWRVADIRAVE